MKEAVASLCVYTHLGIFLSKQLDNPLYGVFHNTMVEDKQPQNDKRKMPKDDLK